MVHQNPYIPSGLAAIGWPLSCGLSPPAFQARGRRTRVPGSFAVCLPAGGDVITKCLARSQLLMNTSDRVSSYV